MKSITAFLIVLSLTSSGYNCHAQEKPPQASVEERLTYDEKEILRLHVQIEHLEREIQTLNETPEIRIPREVRNNLRILEAALEQYCLDHRVKECKFTDLVGEGKYVDAPRQKICDGERYDGLRLALGEPEWRITTKSGITVVFPKPPFDEKWWKKMTEPIIKAGSTNGNQSKPNPE